MRIVTASVVAAAAAAVLSAPAAAQTGWIRIGAGDVSGDSGRATVAARSEPQFRQLMICVEQHPIRITEAEIRYRDGRSQPIRIRELIDKQDCSRFLRLSGRERDVASVDLSYDAASLSGQVSRVELYAR